MLWLKAFHIVFVVAWFAALFYLPRLFVYHCDVRDADGHARFCTMERRLFLIGSIGMAGSVVLGVLMLWLAPWMLKAGWMHAKLALAVLLIGYHHWLIVPLRAFRAQRNTRSARFYRIANELPAVFLVLMVVLVVVKPF